MNLQPIKNILGPKGFIDDPAGMAPYLTEWRDRWSGKTPLIARPKSTEEVAAVVKVCAAQSIPIVPQGGHTGLCGGAMPDGTGDQIVLSLDRMTRIIDVDAGGYAMTVEAGSTLAEVQAAAANADRLFPLSLASEGTAQIGGVLSTNAGGNAVFRYGTARQLALGLEVVLADGGVWNGLTSLGKDNTGYDLRDLFIGAEGTLGIITAAVLKLFPAPRQTATAFIGIGDIDHAVALLARLRDGTGDQLSAIELVPRIGLEAVTRHMERCRDPLAAPHDWYLLVETTSPRDGNDLSDALERALAKATEDGLIDDAAIAQSDSQREDFWRLRDNLSEAQKYEGGSIKHDISVPVRHIPHFIRHASETVSALVPGIRPVPFGHIGDGNIHFNLSQPEGADQDAYLARWEEINRVVHDIVVSLGGSISAEHGIGQLKVDELEHYASAEKLGLMRAIKAALDPHNIMNPGKVIHQNG